MISIPRNIQDVFDAIDALPEEERFVSHDKHCFLCGKLGQLKCGKCKVSRYCSKECQGKHWATHKKACKIDSEAHVHVPKVEARGFCFDPNCYHGAPEPGSSKGAVAAINFVTHLESEKLSCRYDEMSSAEKTYFVIDACKIFCEDNPKDATRPEISQILWSMALEAFMDSQGGTCRELMRPAAFFECFAIGGAGFIESLTYNPSDSTKESSDAASPTPLDNPGYIRLMEFLQQTVSRKGLVEALKLRITCGCMREKPVAKKNK